MNTATNPVSATGTNPISATGTNTSPDPDDVAGAFQMLAGNGVKSDFDWSNFKGSIEDMSISDIASAINSFQPDYDSLGPAPGMAGAVTVDGASLGSAVMGYVRAAQEEAQRIAQEAIKASQERTDALNQKAISEIADYQRWQEAEIAKWKADISREDPSGLASLSATENLNNMLESGSKYIDNASTIAEQALAQRGLNNSSMAVQAGVQGAIERAAPLAISDAELANMRWQQSESSRAQLVNTHLTTSSQHFLSRMNFTFNALLDVNQADMQGANMRGQTLMQGAIVAGQVHAEAEMQNAREMSAAIRLNTQIRWQNYMQDKSFLQQSASIAQQGAWGIVNQEMGFRRQKELANIDFLYQMDVLDANTAASLKLQENELASRNWIASLQASTQERIAQLDIDSRQLMMAEGFEHDAFIQQMRIDAERLLQEDSFTFQAGQNIVNQQFTRDMADLQFIYSNSLQDSAQMHQARMQDNDILSRTQMFVLGLNSQERIAGMSAVSQIISGHSAARLAILTNPEVVGNNTLMNDLLKSSADATLDDLQFLSLSYGMDIDWDSYGVQ